MITLYGQGIILYGQVDYLIDKLISSLEELYIQTIASGLNCVPWESAL